MKKVLAVAICFTFVAMFTSCAKEDHYCHCPLSGRYITYRNTTESAAVKMCAAEGEREIATTGSGGCMPVQ